MTRTARTGLAALALLACTACNPSVMGNGVYVTRTFGVDAFDRLDVGYGFTVNVMAGAPARTVEISGDENIVNQYLSVGVASSTLRIDRTEEFVPVHAVTIHIDAPELVAVTAREGTEVTASGLTAASFQVRASASSHVALSGSPGPGAVLTATLEGSSELDARAFPVASAELALSNHAEARLLCSGPVTGSASGGSAVTVEGGGTCGVVLSGSTCTAAPSGP